MTMNDVQVYLHLDRAYAPEVLNAAGIDVALHGFNLTLPIVPRREDVVRFRRGDALYEVEVIAIMVVDEEYDKRMPITVMATPLTLRKY
jgi:hypothetical protein